MLLTNKKQLGQFFTTNSDNILRGLEKFVEGKNIVDPFAGGGDLIAWARKNNAGKAIGFDVDKDRTDGKMIYYNDTLICQQNYEFVLTNPPYLNINKASKETKENYFSKFPEHEDLYQISIDAIMDSKEGILIVPINFLSAENSKNIRNKFFNKFSIDFFNYFTYQVFSDTTYNVIAAHYRIKTKEENEMLNSKVRIFYDDSNFEDHNISLEKKFDWAIGREYIAPILKSENKLGIYRFEEKHADRGNKEAKVAWTHIKNIVPYYTSGQTLDLLRKNIIFLKAIDSGSFDGRIALEDIREYKLDGLVSKPTSRHMVQLIFPDHVSVADQEKLIEIFNKEFDKLREKSLSLFLTNYRDKNRKRVGFDFVYKMLNHLYFEKINKNNQLAVV